MKTFYFQTCVVDSGGKEAIMSLVFLLLLANGWTNLGKFAFHSFTAASGVEHKEGQEVSHVGT